MHADPKWYEQYNKKEQKVVQFQPLAANTTLNIKDFVLGTNTLHFIFEDGRKIAKSKLDVAEKSVAIAFLNNVLRTGKVTPIGWDCKMLPERVDDVNLQQLATDAAAKLNRK